MATITDDRIPLDQWGVWTVTTRPAPMLSTTGEMSTAPVITTQSPMSASIMARNDAARTGSGDVGDPVSTSAINLWTGPRKRFPAPAASRTAKVGPTGEVMRDSLPEVRITRGFVHVALVACLWGTVVPTLEAASAGSAVQPPRESAAASARRTLTEGRYPGAAFMARPELVRDAVAAVGLAMSTVDMRDATYLAARRKVSDGVAARMKIDADRLAKAWSRAPRDHQIAVLVALTQLGVRYVEGEEDPYRQVDCSGLLWYAWRSAGVDMPRQAVSQLDKRMRIEPEDALAGDVVGYGTHVHIYLGVDSAMVHAPFSGRMVKLKHMPPEQLAVSAWANPSNIATFRL